LFSESVSSTYALFFAPPNDNCATASSVTINSKKECDQVTKVDLTGATNSGTSKPIKPGTASTYCDTTSNATNMPDVWYKFTAGSTKHNIKVSNVTAGSGTVFMVLYRTKDVAKNKTYTCNSATDMIGLAGSVVDCSFSFTKDNSITYENLIAGDEYYIRFYTSGASTTKFDLCITSPPGTVFVSPSGDMYTVEELVKDVFVKSGCDLVSNVQYKNGDGGPAARLVNTLGYFAKNKADFGYENGIVLGTGPIHFAGRDYKGGAVSSTLRGTNVNRITKGVDKDLDDLIDDSGGWANSTVRATQLSFDFTPIKDDLSFEYLFAANSFTHQCSYQCQNGAMFGAWLIDLTTGQGENLAKVPGTNQPITMATVRDGVKIGACTSVNAEYFDRFFDGGAITNPPANEAPVDFAGITLPMKSNVVKVIAGRKYRIKLAVLDFCQTDSHTSAAFFKAGSFDLGMPDLGEDMSIEDGTAACAGETVTIGKDLDLNFYHVQWMKDGVDIPGANNGKLNVTTPGSYSARLTYRLVNCTSVLKPIKVEFYDEIIFEKEPIDLEVCKSGAAFTKVNLEKALEGITYSKVDYSFYLTQLDAEADNNRIPNIYEMDNIGNSQKVYVRIQQQGTPCFVVKNFNIFLKNCNVIVADLPDMHQCAKAGVTDYEFDLKQYDNLAAYGKPGYLVSYHKTESDARSNANPIINADKYLGKNKEEIWVRVERIGSTPPEYNVTSFKLFIDALPVANNNISDYIACTKVGDTEGNFVLRTKDNEVTNSVSGLEISYHESLIDAETGIKPVNKDSYLSGSKSIYFRIKSLKTGCFTVGEFSLVVGEPILIGGNTVYYSCSNNGFAEFNLDVIGANKVSGNSHTSGVTYEFYRFESDALDQVNKLDKYKFYTNAVFGGEVVYLRVNGKGGCYEIVPVELKVSETPKLTQPTPIYRCVSGGNAGIVDLTVKETEILQGVNIAKFEISYYTTSTNAHSGDYSKRIIDPTKYNLASGPNVYVRVENIVDGGRCYTVTELTIKDVVKPLIPNNIKPLETCDDIANTGHAVFELELKKNEISNDPSVVITFYETNSDANSGTNALNEKAYKNTSLNQEIWVRVEDKVTGCFSIGHFGLKVNPYPAYDMIKGGVLTSCTYAANLQGEFNLLEAAQLSIVGIDAYDISHHVTEADAINNKNRIPNPDVYTNTGVQKDYVWIRIKHRTTGCVGIYKITLLTNKAPNSAGNLKPLVACDMTGDFYDGFTEFDLTFYEVDILKGLEAGHKGKITYHLTENNANAGTSPIADPTKFVNTKNNQVIYYRLVDTNTGCFVVGSFILQVKIGLKLEVPKDLVLCSDLKLGQNKAYFDLTTNNIAIVGEDLNLFEVEFHYFESEQDAINNVNEVPAKDTTKYVNKLPIQSIWVVVTAKNGCRTMVIQKIIADALPEPNYNPASITTCEGAKAKEGKFSLVNASFGISKGDPTMEITFHLTKADAEANANPITEYEGPAITIYARVINKLSVRDPKCYVIVEQKLEITPKPKLVKENLVWYVCIDGAVAPVTHTFDLKELNERLLVTGNSADYRFSYHKDIADAEANKDPLLYVQVVNGRRELIVRVEDRKAGCVTIEKVVLSAEVAIKAIKPAEGLISCGKDGIGSFNLTSKTAEIIGVDQKDQNLKVEYYASEADYLAGKAIATPNSFKNTSNPQTIIAIVKSNDANLSCSARTTFELKVQNYADAPVLTIKGDKKEGIVCYDQATGKYTSLVIETGYSGTEYEFIWMKDNKEFGAPDLPYLVTSEAGVYKVRVAFRDRISNCFVESATILVNRPELLNIKIKGQDSTGLIGSFEDNEDGTAVIIIEEPKDVYDENGYPVTLYEFALNDGVFQSNRVFYNVSNGSHKVWARPTTGNGKVCPQYKEFFVLGYMKYFTPNGDGYNDTWNIPALKGHPEAVIYIYDRYGKLIKQISPMGEGWDGTFNGKPMPSTDYWFTVEYRTDGLPSRKVSHKGHFSLKR
jgi:gliding motility-associated-like protein